jgi:tetratricopeptide (TPR) repeat protein
MHPQRHLRVRSLTLVLALMGMVAWHPPGEAALDIEEYQERAEAAKKRGDWQALASNMAEVINHRDAPRDAATKSFHHLEYARAMGVLCDWKEAGEFLSRAKQIAINGKLPPTLALYEQASLNVAQKKFDVALALYEELAPLIGNAGAGRLNAVQAVDALNRHADVLLALGRVADAEARRRAAVGYMDPGGAGAAAGGTTPYGARCPQ